MSTLILFTDILEKIILLMLIGFSIWSISIIIDRKRLFKAEFAPNAFLDLQKKLLNAGNKTALEQSLATYPFLDRVVLKSLQQSTDANSFEKALSGVVKIEKLKFEKGLSVLGTLGANAPFIGLFGTVLGIIRAFAYLGSQTGSSAVMSGVSQALYATALGLLVAIPAVVANNYFAHSLRNALQQGEALRDEMVARKIV
ncbi:MAG: MotA/TolQ/ExbB proton channel family protein [Bdellovibrionaceae bacterium]|nr:MotA/TolQ/ExbB proton channel family protein [Bdellovibrio sp.]